MIVLTGDIIDSSAKKEDAVNLSSFLARLGSYGPAFAVLGNHELISDGLRTYKNELETAGIILLENEVKTIEIKGRSLAVAGILDKAAYNLETVKGLAATSPGVPIILLAHRPEKWEDYLAGTSSRAPLITFAGHAHGGQIQLFGRGVYAPGYGYWPKYYDGLYKNKAAGKYLVVSRGLGDSNFPFRAYNSYHLPLVTVNI